MSNINIWGVRSGLIGDTIMALPISTYLKKKYPDSKLTWVIQKKCSQAAPIYINSKSIDNIYVTEGWEGLSELDIKYRDGFDIVINEQPPIRDKFGFNSMCCIEMVARMAGIDDINSELTSDELFPKLTKWWIDPSSQHNPLNNGYSTVEHFQEKSGLTIGIFPFAHYGSMPNRSPTKEWWDVVCEKLDGYDIRHFGWITEPRISNTKMFTHLSYFEQIKLALECDIVIGTDTGSMWVLGAYSVPAIHIMTYHMDGHNDNPSALCPKNRNGVMLFNPTNCNLVKPNLVIEEVKKYEENMFGTRYNIQ